MAFDLKRSPQRRHSEADFSATQGLDAQTRLTIAIRSCCATCSPDIPYRHIERKFYQNPKIPRNCDRPVTVGTELGCAPSPVIRLDEVNSLLSPQLMDALGKQNAPPLIVFHGSYNIGKWIDTVHSSDFPIEEHVGDS